MSLLDELPDRCSIYSQRFENDAFGGRSIQSVLVASNVECWEQQAGASEIQEFSKKGFKVSRNVYFTSNPNVSERSEIIVTSRRGVAVPESQQSRLEVYSDPRPDVSAGFGILYRVTCGENTGASQ